MADKNGYKEADQHEKAYQKQDAIFIGKRRVLGKAKRGKGFLGKLGIV